jgi:ribosomal protein S1
MHRVKILGGGGIKFFFFEFIYKINIGCLVNIAQGSVARAATHELSDEFIESPELFFTPNKLIIARVKEVRADGKIDITMKESVVRSGYKYELEKLNTGVTVTGTVIAFYKGKASVQLHSCKYRALLSLK